MIVYDFFPSDSLEIAYIPSKTVEEACKLASNDFPGGGTLCHNGNLVRKVPPREKSRVVHADDIEYLGNK